MSKAEKPARRYGLGLAECSDVRRRRRGLQRTIGRGDSRFVCGALRRLFGCIVNSSVVEVTEQCGAVGCQCGDFPGRVSEGVT